MAVILPFEEAFYRQRGMTVRFVGHPLVDEVRPVQDRATCRRLLGLGAEPVVCLLPGSRQGEVRTFLPILLNAASRIKQACPSAEMLLALAPGLDSEEIASVIRAASVPLRCLRGDTYRAIRAADAAMAVSGTVTLESALLGTPLVVVYKVSPVEYHLGRRLIRVPHIALPNVILGRRVCPELIQHEARPERIAQEVLDLIRNPERAAAQRRWFEQLSRMLGEPGAAGRAAVMALDLC
jgi:lipid-A-disaccharide synthase